MAPTRRTSRRKTGEAAEAAVSAGAGAGGVAATPAPSLVALYELLDVVSSPRPGWFIVVHRRVGVDERVRTNVNPELLAQKLRRAPNEAQRALWEWQLLQLPT